MEGQSSSNHSSYIINAADPSEIARVQLQHRIVTRNMGSIFPSGLDLNRIHRVLDIGCAAGDWVCEVAFEYSMMDIVGIDISRYMIEYARTCAEIQQLSNTTFKVMDARQPLEFDDESFDFVNARFLIGAWSPEAWPALLNECQRILRPDGWICLTETDSIAGVTNSAALDKMREMGVRSFQKTGRSFFREGPYQGITPMLGRLLAQGGYQKIQRKAFAIDWSAGEEAHEGWSQNFAMFAHLGKMFIVKTGIATEEEFNAVYLRAMADIHSPDFISMVYLCTTLGQKSQ